MTTFSENLKRLMKERRVSAKVVSEATGIPPSTISEWTAGREPKLGDALIRLARFFGVSLEYLATGEEKEPQPEDFLNALDDSFITIHQGVYRMKLEKLKKK